MARCGRTTLAALERVLETADGLGMVVILGLFYFGQDHRLRDETAVIRAVEDAVGWVLDRGYRNVLIEITNECDLPRYTHAILTPPREHELIERAQAIVRGGRRLLASTSYRGRSLPGETVARCADFLLLHGNGENNPAPHPAPGADDATGAGLRGQACSVQRGRPLRLRPG